MVFHGSLSDSKSPQVYRTLLSILTVLNNVVVWMVSTCPSTSKSSSPFSNPLVTVPKATITIGIIVTCLFHSFFNFLAMSRYLSFFSHFFSCNLWSVQIAKSTILQVLFLLWLIIISVHLLFCCVLSILALIWLVLTGLFSAAIRRDSVSLLKFPFLRRCPWCNGYRRRKWTRRHEFKSWTRLIAFHIALIPLGKVWLQLFSLHQWVNSRAD